MPRFNSALFLSCVFSLLLHVTYAQTPEGFVPSVQTSLNVTYGTNAVSPAGELIPRPETARPPTVNIPTVTSASTFVLFMIDLDVPRNNTRLTLLHWFVPSATLSGQTNNTLLVPATNSSGASYLQPSPPVGDIPHRYVFLVFARPDNFTVPSQFAAINPPSSTQARIGFNISEFVAAAGLGQPLAANYIRVQNTTATSTATGSSAGTGTGAGASQTSVEAVQRNNALAKRGLEWGMVATAVTGFLGVWVLDL